MIEFGAGAETLGTPLHLDLGKTLKAAGAG